MNRLGATSAAAAAAATWCSTTSRSDRLLADIDAPLQGELDLWQQHPLIRDGDDYADLFTLGAQTSATTPPTKESHQ
jgi:hypothetical protein